MTHALMLLCATCRHTTTHPEWW